MRPSKIVRLCFFVALMANILLVWPHHRVAGLWLNGGLLVLLLHANVLGAIFIRWNYFLKAIHHGPCHVREVCLTFDDGPAKHTDAILDVLWAEGVPAAFFLIGKNVKAHPELVRRMVDDGHTVGNHSMEHGFHFDWKSAKGMFQEMMDCNLAIAEASGVRPRFFRPPYGVTNPNLARAVALSGIDAIGWSLRSFDTKAKSPQALLDKLLRQLKGGDIILLHDSVTATAEILTTFIQEARARGFIFVALPDLIDREPYA